MKKIILNENHIRQLVKETLENLILGEDNMSNILSSEDFLRLIRNSKLIYEPNIEMKKNMGHIVLAYKNKMSGEDFVHIEFKVDGYVEPYYPGNYNTPPEGGECEITNMEPLKAYVWINDNDEYFINVKENEEILKEILNTYYDDIFSSIDWEYFEKNQGPDPDFEYDSWKNDR